MAGGSPEHAGTDRASAALPKEELAFIGVVLAEQLGKTHTQSHSQAGSKKSHLITESQDGFGVERDCKDRLVLTLCHGQGHLPLEKV